MYGTQRVLTDETKSHAALAKTTKTTSRYHAVEEEQDSELLKYLQMGLPDAFSILMRRYHRRLMILAFGITGSHEDSEDAIQSTFLQVYKHIGGFRGECKLTTWLTRIAINQSLQVLRRRKGREISIDDFVEHGNTLLRDELKASGDTPEESILRKELGEKLLKTLRSLREPSRRVAEMHYVHGLSSHEIAGVIGISATAAKSRLVRARRELRREAARRLNPSCPPPL